MIHLFPQFLSCFLFIYASLFLYFLIFIDIFNLPLHLFLSLWNLLLNIIFVYCNFWILSFLIPLPIVFAYFAMYLFSLKVLSVFIEILYYIILLCVFGFKYFICYFLLLKYSWHMMLCQFQMNNIVIQKFYSLHNAHYNSIYHLSPYDIITPLHKLDNYFIFFVFIFIYLVWCLLINYSSSNNNFF